ncbi:cytochrome P450, putative [Ricinus communis]|uniref:Cytochrome P450, putative n=1 Tax=Ricinus communis TaxID=3988 RepID=B9RHX6_RICCO|nr:cytochrome P450, putative [Ricinus communis]
MEGIQIQELNSKSSTGTTAATYNRKHASLSRISSPSPLGRISQETWTCYACSAAKEVMKTHDVVFAQRPTVFAASIIAYDNKDIAFAPNGPYWRQLRKMCAMELLSAKRVQSFRSIREEEVSAMIQSIYSSAGSPVNITKFINALTYRVISRAAFGKVWNGEEEFLSAVEQIMLEVGKGVSLADVFPSIKLLRAMSGMKGRVEKLFKQVDFVFQSILTEHKVSRKELGAEREKEGEDLIHVLLDLQKQEDLEFPLTDENIKAVIMDIFVAGTDTSATTIEWTISELMRNPRVLQKAQEEVRRVFGEKGNVDEAGLHHLSYVKMVLSEALRMHPPAPLVLPRESKEHCVVQGYDIPAKSKVMVNAWAIGRDPKSWTEPDEFYPERFINSSVDFKGANYEFIPFGAGRRICPGLLFGVAAVELPIAQLLYHFDWIIPGGVKPENLDMTEDFGAAVRRKNDLILIPNPYINSAFHG